MQLNRSSMLYRSLITYIGIAVLACVIVGGVSYTTAARQIALETRAAETKQLSAAATDLANHLDIMETIALEIKTSMNYQPFFLNRNPLNKVELLNNFQKFSTYSPIIEKYYLYYQQEDIVFSTTGEYRFSLFSRAVMGIQNVEQLRQTIEKAYTFFHLSSMPEKAFLVLPISFRALNARSQAYLIFEINKDTLLLRYSELFNLSGAMNFDYNGIPFFEKLEFVNGITVSSTLDRASVVIEMDCPAQSHDHFSNSMLAGIVSIIIVLSSTAAFLAYRNYQPVQRLVTKLQLNRANNQNEIELIESVVDNLIMEHQDIMVRLTGSLERVTTLTQLLKERIVLCLVIGKLEEDWESHIADAGMMLHRPFLCALFIPYSKSIRELQKCMEEGSSSEAAVYTAILPDKGGLVAITSANADDDLESFVSFLEDAIYTAGYNDSLYKGKIVNHLKDLPISFHTAQMKQSEGNDGKIEPWLDPESSDCIYKAIAEGDTLRAISIVNEVIDEISANSPSTLMKQYSLMRFVFQLLDVSRKVNHHLSEHYARQALLADNEMMLKECVTDIVKQMIDKNGAKETDISTLSDNARNILAFISDHAFTSTMCLDYVADEFNLSTKQISRIIKSSTGTTFKTYLLNLRMEEAIRLLKSGVHPSEVTLRIGFWDERYFKTRFRAYTGESAMHYYLSHRTVGAEDES